MKQKSKIRKRKFTTATKSRSNYMLNGVKVARGTKKLTNGVRPWLYNGAEYLKQ